jgi:hypothetical protein
MNQTSKQKLPPNPYSRSPIKKREDLAGRASEQKRIRYYLNLTASGQNPHLALIGQRGIGKTSLLNGAESIARDLKLLPVRLDMNELKAKSPGRFWHDLYQTLALSMAKAGCWGGVQGPIYAELLRMINSRERGDLEKAVMQIPYLFSCHQGNIDTFECPDALVVEDFKSSLGELRTKGLSGIAIMIDEADCLAKNVALLQMFRNIFQAVDHCSLLLAGTEAVFPALSEVFSPIPRQFHRIDVKPFARWFSTRQLVLHPLPKEILDSIAPESDVMQELHELCGGAPDEVQLYCHHMYRGVEEGSSERMALSPYVFREVLHEYRSNSPADGDAVLNAIERLPDKLLYQSKWLSRRALTLEENIRVTVLQKELKRNKALSADERSEVARELTEGYRALLDAGIIEIDNCIRLTGAPLTAGFWKSFVKVERGERWSWNDFSFTENLHGLIIHAIGKGCDAAFGIPGMEGRDAVAALRRLREGKTPREFDEGMGEMIASALIGLEDKLLYAADLTVVIDSPAGKHVAQGRFLEKIDVPITWAKIRDWIEDHRALLAGNDISISVTAVDRWKLPTAHELRRLGRIAGYPIPDVFGPRLVDEAVTKFKAGNIPGCADDFSRMLRDKEDPGIRNNLAFCQLLMGKICSALENSSKAMSDGYEPLFELNKGIGEFLQGKADAAKESLRNALSQLRAPEKNVDHDDPLFVLVLESGATSLTFQEALPLGAAILLNLWRMGDLTRAELETELIKSYPERAQAWLTSFAAPLLDVGPEVQM